MPKKNHVESHIQIDCVKWFRSFYPELKPLLFSVPNGAYTTATQAAILKAEGMTAGVADLLLLVPKQGYSCLAIEMKSGTGEWRKSQKEWKKELEEKGGGKYVLCRSKLDFIREIEGYLGKSRLGDDRDVLLKMLGVNTDS